jgi:hypothetical protein
LPIEKRNFYLVGILTLACENMSQIEVFIILKDLGGIATGKEIIEQARAKFPNYSLANYVYIRLSKLCKSGYVTHDSKNMTYKIIDESIISDRNLKT